MLTLVEDLLLIITNLFGSPLQPLVAILMLGYFVVKFLIRPNVNVAPKQSVDVAAPADSPPKAPQPAQWLGLAQEKIELIQQQTDRVEFKLELAERQLNHQLRRMTMVKASRQTLQDRAKSGTPREVQQNQTSLHDVDHYLHTLDRDRAQLEQRIECYKQLLVHIPELKQIQLEMESMVIEHQGKADLDKGQQQQLRALEARAGELLEHFNYSSIDKAA